MQRNLKVEDLIKVIIVEFLQDQNTDKRLLKYPKNPEAYELRILEDEDKHYPDMTFPPLDTDRIISKMEFDSVVFMEKSDFVLEEKKKSMKEVQEED